MSKLFPSVNGDILGQMSDINNAERTARNSQVLIESVVNDVIPDSSPSQELEDQASDILTLPEVFEDPYEPPPVTFIEVLFGATERMVLNSKCRRKIFMDYLKERIGAKERNIIDLCDEAGTLLGIYRLEDNDQVDHLFQRGETYVPCIITLDDEDCLATVKPYLKQCNKRYPHFEEMFNEAIEKEKDDKKEKESQIAKQGNNNELELETKKKKIR